MIYVIIYPNCNEDNYIKINNYFFDMKLKNKIGIPYDEKKNEYNRWRKVFIFKCK